MSKSWTFTETRYVLLPDDEPVRETIKNVYGYRTPALANTRRQWMDDPGRWRIFRRDATYVVVEDTPLDAPAGEGGGE